MSNTLVSPFLRRDVNKALAQVTGNYINRGTGYSLEVPCIYRFYGPEPYIRKLQELLSSLRDDAALNLLKYTLCEIACTTCSPFI